MTEAEEKDAILDILANGQPPDNVVQISILSDRLKIDKSRVEMLCSLLKAEEYIVYHSGPDGACKIKHKGRAFLEQGGYKQQALLKALQEKKAQSKEELEIEQIRSVIATNVATVSAYANQEKLNRRSLLLTGISVLFIVVSTFFQVISKTD